MFSENHTLFPLPFQTVWRCPGLRRDEAPMGRAAQEVRWGPPKESLSPVLIILTVLDSKCQTLAMLNLKSR